MLCFESFLYTASPLLEALLQRLPSEASTHVPPSTSWRRRPLPLIHRVVSYLAGGHFEGAVTSRIWSVNFGRQTHTQLWCKKLGYNNSDYTIMYTYVHVHTWLYIYYVA